MVVKKEKTGRAAGVDLAAAVEPGKLAAPQVPPPMPRLQHLPDVQTVEHVAQAPCSIELSRNAKGQASWTIKAYCDGPNMPWRASSRTRSCASTRCCARRARRSMATRGSRVVLLPELLTRFPVDEETGELKEWLTTPEVMHVTNVHEITVYRWVSEARLPAYRVRASGKANLYKREDVERLLRARFDPKAAPKPHQVDVVVKARRPSGGGGRVDDGKQAKAPGAPVEAKPKRAVRGVR